MRIELLFYFLILFIYLNIVMSKKSKGPVIIKEKSGEILKELEKRLEKAVKEVPGVVKGDVKEESAPINILE